MRGPVIMVKDTISWILSALQTEPRPTVLHCMIDLETLSTRSDAYIRTLGACFFDASGVHETFYESCDGVPQPGAHIDEGTVKWWESQSPNSIVALRNLKRQDLKTVLFAFQHWVERQRKTFSQRMDLSDVEVWVWGNGGDFDPVVLSNAYKRSGMDTPWPFYATRCFRTLKNLNRSIKPQEFTGEKHNALDDAVHQAWHAVRILRRIYW